MENNIKYVHTNLIAKDWKKLADFYINVFKCKPVPPERNLSGNWIDSLTGIPDVKIRGMHLSLPGFDNGPTLEIFEYYPEFADTDINHINRKGFGHIAFHVDSVEETLKMILAFGGSQLGEVIKKDYREIGILTAVYTTDPEGNFIEIQNWKK
ncbi:MAG: glyoxalase [Clostridia bacterium]|jgi:predicted enzyme related to lactoylglutathione lyase|nr:glyoxalase [Clostridia bacterium]